MKNYTPAPLSTVALALGAFIIVSCHVRIPSHSTPKPKAYGAIDQIEVSEGYPLKAEPWVVISDRGNNTVFMDRGDEKSPKELAFLEPLLVVKHNRNKGLVKVAQYNPDALLKKLPANSVKTYGWIPMNQLLLWRNAVPNRKNGFALKGTLVPRNSDVLKSGEKYMKNDSVLLFSSPDLTKALPKKLPVGQLVYVYKNAEENRRYLVGKTPSIPLDSIDSNVYGWVSSNMLAAWGDRTGLRVSPDYNYTEENDLSLQKDVTDGTSSNEHFKLSEAESRSDVENLIGVRPATMRKAARARFFSNALDYSKNFVYNVLGEPLYYPRYREITNRNKNLNIVFTMDVSNENSQNAAVAKSAFQDFQFKLKDLGYYRNVHFGAVLFKNNTCGENVAVSTLSSDFNKIAQFIDEKSMQMNCNTMGGQPMQEGLEAAGDLLTPYRDDTNIVVLVGASANMSGNTANAVRSLSKARARLVSYQTVSGSADTYNNFVLLSENIVTNSARNIAELEKQRTIAQNTVMNRNNYNLQQGEEGIFSLDYPNSSMTQGFVIYPKKGEINSNARLARSLDSLIAQATHQNKMTDAMLTDYFKSPLGSSRTELKAEYRPQFPDAPALIPVETASQLVVYSNPFLTKGSYTAEYENYYPAVQKGILISEKEYEDLKKMYQLIYQETKPYGNEFSQERAVNVYLKILKSEMGDKYKRRTMLQNPMAYSVAAVTGFDNSGEELLSKYKLEGWKKSKVVPSDAVRAYFNQYRMLANRMLENKGNSKIIIDQNGEKFYWLNAYFMPMINPVDQL